MTISMVWQALYIPVDPFVLFSTEHLVALATTLAAAILMIALYWGRDPGDGFSRNTRYILAAILLGSELTWQYWQVAAEVWDIRHSLPLHLCDIGLLLSVIMLIWRVPALFELVYFWAFCGTLQALITPDLGNYNFPHLHFFQYFIGHGVVIISVLFMILSEHFRPRWRSIWKVFWVTNAYAGAVALFNLATNSNYLMLSGKPEVPTLVDYLGPWPGYIIGIEAIGLISCVLYYLPFAIRDRKSKRTDTLL